MTAVEEAFGARVGGRLCLDFVNTVRGRVSSSDTRQRRDYVDRIVGERLPTYDALLRWGTFAEAIDRRDATALRKEASARPGEAAVVLERALGVREAIYRVVKAAIEGWPARAEDLTALNREIRVARMHEQLVVSPHPGWAWEGGRALDRVLWPIVRSAGDLLTSPDLERVGQCPGDECGWLFLDTSRSGRRQWCDMATCGTLAKVHRFRRKHRDRRTSGLRVARSSSS